MFRKLFKRKEKFETQFIIASINGRLQPKHRWELFEDPLDKQLSKLSLGEVSGGGTLQSQSGEIESCDIEIQVNPLSESTVEKIKEILESLGVPKGSKLIVESSKTEIPIGVSEGLGVYLNGTELPDNVYEECDSNVVYEELNRLLEGVGSVQSYWQGPTETALYIYGRSFEEMKNLIQEFLDTYPLCEKCRIVKIA